MERQALKRKIERQKNRFERKRESLFQTLQTVKRATEDDPLDDNEANHDAPQSGTGGEVVPGANPAPSGAVRRLSATQQEYRAQRRETLTRLKAALGDAAAKAVLQSAKAKDKPSLADVARMYLQDVGETVTGRTLLPAEADFVKEAHTASVYVQKVRDLFCDVQGMLEKRQAAINARQEQRSLTGLPEPAEHVTFSEYQKYMRKRGFLRDDREDVPEGNLIPILAVLQGQAEGIGFMKQQRKLLRIGDFVVEIDPNDPLFQRYEDEAAAKADEERRRNFLLYRNGKFKDAEVQTDVRDDDATDAEIALVYRRLDELQSVLEATDRSKLEAELFVETALPRIVALRSSATKMYGLLESGQSTLARLTAEAMSQNERLWKKLDAIAHDRADDRAKQNVQRTFTEQIDRLNEVNLVLKMRLESTEQSRMQQEEDYYYQRTVHEKRMDDLRKQVLPKAVKEQLNALQRQIDESSQEEAGGSFHKEVRSKVDLFVEGLAARARLAASAVPKGTNSSLEGEGVDQAPPAAQQQQRMPFEFLLPPKLRHSVTSTVDTIFSCLDEVALQAQRAVVEMMTHPHNPPLVVERVKEVGDVVSDIRRSASSAALDFVELLLETVFNMQHDSIQASKKAEEDLAEAVKRHREELAQKEEELTRQFQQKMSGAISAEQFEREKNKAVAKEREKFAAQIGKEIPMPQLAVPTMTRDFALPKSLLTPNAQPQDQLHAAATYLTDLTMEMCQLCTRTNQPPPPRLAGVAVALQLIKLAQDKVTTNEGLVDGIAIQVPGGMQAVAPGTGPLVEGPSSKNLAATATEASAIAEKWWQSAGGSAVSATESAAALQKKDSSLTSSARPEELSAITDAAQTRRALGQAAAILKSASHFSTANLSIRTKLAEIAKAPESVVKSTLAAAKEKATELRQAGLIKPKMVESDGTDSPASPKSTKKGKGKSGVTNLDESAMDASTTGSPLVVPPRAPTVDRATSPIRSLKQTQAVVPKAATAEKVLNRVALEQRAAQKARLELSDILSKQYVDLHSVVEYLRIALIAAIGGEEELAQAHIERTKSIVAIAKMENDAVQLFSSQIRQDRDNIERLTSMLLSAAENGALEAARDKYRLVAPTFSVPSRLRMFLSSGKDFGCQCDIIGGGEAVLTSLEAIDYAVTHDMRIFSQKRKLMAQQQKQLQQRQPHALLPSTSVEQEQVTPIRSTFDTSPSTGSHTDQQQQQQQPLTSTVRRRVVGLDSDPVVDSSPPPAFLPPIGRDATVSGTADSLFPDERRASGGGKQAAGGAASVGRAHDMIVAVRRLATTNQAASSVVARTPPPSGRVLPFMKAEESSAAYAYRYGKDREAEWSAMH